MFTTINWLACVKNEFQSLGRRHCPIDTCILVIFPVFPRVFDENTQPEHEDVRACETGWLKLWTIKGGVFPYLITIQLDHRGLDLDLGFGSHSAGLSERRRDRSGPAGRSSNSISSLREGGRGDSSLGRRSKGRRRNKTRSRRERGRRGRKGPTSECGTGPESVHRGIPKDVSANFPGFVWLSGIWVASLADYSRGNEVRQKGKCGVGKFPGERVERRCDFRDLGKRKPGQYGNLIKIRWVRQVN